jgi:hypothetical protein
MRGLRACAKDQRGDSRSRQRAGPQRRSNRGRQCEERGGRLSWRGVRVDFVNPKGLNEKRCHACTYTKPNYGNNNGTDDGETSVPLLLRVDSQN